MHLAKEKEEVKRRSSNIHIDWLAKLLNFTIVMLSGCDVYTGKHNANGRVYKKLWTVVKEKVQVHSKVLQVQWFCSVSSSVPWSLCLLMAVVPRLSSNLWILFHVMSGATRILEWPHVGKDYDCLYWLKVYPLPLNRFCYVCGDWG